MMPVAVIVEWYGPYEDLTAFRHEARRNWPDGMRTLYMALGSHNVIRYIGLTGRPVARICNTHDQLEADGNMKFYIGQIVSQGISGRRNTKQPSDLKLAEHALVRYFRPELNTNLVYTDPEDSISIFSCFFDPEDLETVWRPLSKFPALVAFNYWSGEWSCS